MRLSINTVTADGPLHTGGGETRGILIREAVGILYSDVAARAVLGVLGDSALE